jgi:hypothetical protein
MLPFYSHCKKLMPPVAATELWQVGILHQPIIHVVGGGRLTDAQVTWLPDPGPFRFIADPFGIFHNDRFTVLVEALDYRVKRGVIDYYSYDSTWKLVAQGRALSAPHHLSYPSLLREDGEIYMLPEAHRSGRLTLYRAVRFPDQWEEVAVLLDVPAIDASVVQYQGLWWMFYALPGAAGRAMRELHIAHAPRLGGPWLPHAQNPVRVGLDSSRPGGQPFVHAGSLYLPTQDCLDGYGMAVNLLNIAMLTPQEFGAQVVTHLSPHGLHPDYSQGLHTLSGEGNVTLVDVKRVIYSRGRAWINLKRRVCRLFGF